MGLNLESRRFRKLEHLHNKRGKGRVQKCCIFCGQWVKLDLEYIDDWSLWLDLKIFFKTVGVVLVGTGR